MGRHLPRICLPATGLPDRWTSNPVLLRRNVPVDRSRRDHGFHGAGRKSPGIAPVREPVEEGESEIVRQALDFCLIWV